MNLAIHNRAGSFSDRWIAYCNDNGIAFREVDCFASDAIHQLEGVTHLMWHWSLAEHQGLLFARQLVRAIEAKGILVFPSSDDCWHYDDKIAQKYLFEALDMPSVASYVFYQKETAQRWAVTTSYPKVFKLRGGAGSVNVSLVRNQAQALRLIRRAFSVGFSSVNRSAVLGDRVRSFKKAKNFATALGILKCLGRYIFPSPKERQSPREIGYVYFQDFIPKNEWDTRLIVIGDRCIGVRRYCRKGDFRASGSGQPAYDLSFFPKIMVAEAFRSSRKLKMQSVAFDFIEQDGEYLIVEVSYCYITGSFYDDCPGYWDSSLRWHAKPVDPQRFILEDFLKLSRA